MEKDDRRFRVFKVVESLSLILWKGSVSTRKVPTHLKVG
jgi:hypothetical protein